MQLREYQKKCVEKMLWEMQQNLEGHSLVCLPTGAGKSIVIAEFVNMLDQDVLILQPSKEILEQNKNKLLQYVRPDEVGVYSASASEKEIRKYTFATIGSIYKIPDEFQHFKIILIDEAHTLNPKRETSMLTEFINSIHGVKVFGLTATPYRIFPSYFREGFDLVQSNAIKILTRIQPRFWHRILFNINNHELVEQGFICPLEYYDRKLLSQEEMPLNKGGTDFDFDALDIQLSQKEMKIVEVINEVRANHKAILVFCTSIRQAQRLASCVPNSMSVSSETPTKERDAIISAFKNGEVQIVFNVGVLTTGFDMPTLDCILLARPTRSIALYYQMLGRGVRIAEGKTHCKVYDFTDTCNKLGGIESIKLAKDETGKWEIFTDTGRWHGRKLYSFVISK